MGLPEDGGHPFSNGGLASTTEGLDLAVRDPPVGGEERVLALAGDKLEPVLSIGADRPLGCGPGADQHPSLGRAREMLEQRAPHPLHLARGQDVGMTDEIEVAHRLDPHNAD
jgi:hypothetical protein